MKAVWNEQVLAESEDAIKLEGNSYFPPESVQAPYLKPTLPAMRIRHAAFWNGVEVQP